MSSSHIETESGTGNYYCPHHLARIPIAHGPTHWNAGTKGDTHVSAAQTDPNVACRQNELTEEAKTEYGGSQPPTMP